MSAQTYHNQPPEREAMSTTYLPPLTAADFELYDDEHTYPFYEDDDGRIFGYGHPDKAWAAAQVKAYYDHTDPGGYEDDHRINPADIAYRWAVRVDDGTGGEFRFVYARHAEAEPPYSPPVPVMPDEPGAFPIWTV